MDMPTDSSTSSDDDTAFLINLCNLQVPSSIKFSPSGQQLLYSTNLIWNHYSGSTPISTLWLASTNQASSARKLTSGSAKDYAPAWRPDGHRIAFISDRADPGRKWAIHMMDVPLEEPTAYSSIEDDMTAVAITDETNERSIDMFKFSPDGSKIAFVSADEKTDEQKDWAYARLRIVEVTTKSVVSLPIPRHVIDVCWSPDGQRLALLSTNTPDFEDRFLNGAELSIVAVNLELSTLRSICKIPKASYTDLTWGDDGRLYCLDAGTSNLGYAGHGVYAVDPEAPPAEFKHVSFAEDSDAVRITKAGGRIVVRLEHGLESRVVLLNGKVLYKRQEELEAFDVFFHDDDHDEVVLAVSTSNLNTPAEVYSTTTSPLSTAGTDNSTMTKLSNHGAHFTNHTIGTCTLLSVPTSDGATTIDAMYLSPASSSSGLSSNRHPLPNITLIHGGPNTRLAPSFAPFYYHWAAALLRANISVLLPNYRGSSGRGRTFASWSHSHPTKYAYADILACTQHAIDAGLADPTRLAIGGYSHGGMLALWGAVKNDLQTQVSGSYDWTWKASIAGASIADSDSMALTSDLGAVYQPELQEGRVAWNMETFDARNRRASPLWHFHDAVERGRRGKGERGGECEGEEGQKGGVGIPPLLLLHSAEDRRSHVSQAVGMRRAMESAGLEFEMAIYPRQGHFFHEQKAWVDSAKRVRRWCDMHIGRGKEEKS